MNIKGLMTYLQTPCPTTRDNAFCIVTDEFLYSLLQALQYMPLSLRTMSLSIAWPNDDYLF